MAKGLKHVGNEGKDIIRRMKKEGLPKKKIAKILGRDVKTIRRHLKPSRGKPAVRGRPGLSDAWYRRLVAALDSLQKKAGGLREVTVAMVKRRARCPYGERAILDAFHDHGIYFKPLRAKPILTKADRAKRRVFAGKNKRRTKKQWVFQPHATIDNKSWQLFLNHKGRVFAARRAVRGALRRRGDGLKPHLVKPKAGNLKYSAPSVQVTAAVIKGRIRMWRYTTGRRWNGNEAASMYKGDLSKALKKAYPEVARRPRAKFVVMEDNDPAGYKSSKGIAAKSEARMSVLALPPRSPDLNVLDYSLWKAIATRMREQEAKFRSSRVETKEQYKARLRRTALGLPTAEVTKAVQAMHKRVRMVAKERGGLIKCD